MEGPVGIRNRRHGEFWRVMVGFGTAGEVRVERRGMIWLGNAGKVRLGAECRELDGIGELRHGMAGMV